MNFQQLLKNLKNSHEFNRSSITKEIIANIRYINKNELLDVLVFLRDSVDIEFQVTLLSILTVCLLFDISNRDVIIKWTSLYETLRKIISRGLPMKSAVTLDFVSALLYAEDEGGSRSRTLTLHAQCMFRNSGCLTEITHLFTSYMLPVDTWKALCRCVAQVCQGSELNQTFCSHLIPLCIQRCLQGNLDAFPVLQSLLLNNKRNTHLFLNAGGRTLFDRKELMRVKDCLQLLNTVIQNSEYEALCEMTKQTRIHEYLHELLNLSPQSSITQWATITLYYFDSKLKDGIFEDKSNYKNDSMIKTNVLNKSQVNQLTDIDDTQILLRNIMTEILADPPEGDSHQYFSAPHQRSNIKEITSPIPKAAKLHGSKNNNLRRNITSRNSSTSLSFSYHNNETIKCNKSHRSKRNRTANNRVNITKRTCCGRELGHSQHPLKTFESVSENKNEFKPKFFSTPLRELSQDCLSTLGIKRCFLESSKKSRIFNRTAFKKQPKNSLTQDKSSIKHRSLSSKLLAAINKSCTTIIKSVKNVFIGNKDLSDETQSAREEAAANQTYCSYSFTNYMKKRECELIKPRDDTDANSEANTYSTMSTCRSCNDTLLLKQKFDNDDNLKLTVNKLKIGINLYGCDFKKISKTMWPRERYMTPKVLYNLYRKLIFK